MRINDSKMFSFRMKNSLVLSPNCDDTAATVKSAATTTNTSSLEQYPEKSTFIALSHLKRYSMY